MSCTPGEIEVGGLGLVDELLGRLVTTFIVGRSLETSGEGAEEGYMPLGGCVALGRGE